MQTRITTNSYKYHFTSMVELGDFIANAPRKWRTDESRTTQPGASWDLNVGYDGAVQLAQNGWTEGAQRAQDALKVFTPVTPEPDTKIDFYGFRPHVPRYCAGAPDSMIRRDPIDPIAGAGKVLTLAVPLFISCSVSAARAANYGIALAQYINQMETQGTRVEVIGSFVQTCGKARTSLGVTVKYADQPLDLAVLAFAIGHPAMFRRIGFAVMERSDIPCDPYYGLPVKALASDYINAPHDVIVLGGINEGAANSATPALALAYLEAQITKLMEAQLAE